MKLKIVLVMHGYYEYEEKVKLTCLCSPHIDKAVQSRPGYYLVKIF